MFSGGLSYLLVYSKEGPCHYKATSEGVLVAPGGQAAASSGGDGDGGDGDGGGKKWQKEIIQADEPELPNDDDDEESSTDAEIVTWDHPPLVKWFSFISMNRRLLRIGCILME